MAKMTDKKPAKAKPKAKTSNRAKARAAASAKAGPVVATAVRQPGVERRQNHPMRAKNGFMSVILTQPVPHCGQAGDLVKVKPGFGATTCCRKGWPRSPPRTTCETSRSTANASASLKKPSVPTS